MYCPDCGERLECYEGEVYCADCSRWATEEAAAEALDEALALRRVEAEMAAAALGPPDDALPF